MKQSPYGSRVLITGVTGGIGLAIAELFIQNGFRVAGCSRHKSETLPEGLSWFSMDVCDDDSVRTCVEQAVQALGGIDILIHCAGMGIGGSVEDVSPEELRHQLDVNTLGFIRTAQAVLPGMRAQHRGHLLPISSIAGFISIPYQSSYQQVCSGGVGAGASDGNQAVWHPGLPNRAGRYQNRFYRRPQALRTGAALLPSADDSCHL